MVTDAILPRVSICVPNLNTRPFLPERFHTIRQQSFHDWELLVYDSYSDDGAWEYIQQLTEVEPRMRCWQGPREGVQAGWNSCLSRARGEYVYVATSDDTMPPDCLEKLVAALDAHPDCDIAHCRLRMIDERGDDLPDWWSEASVFARSSRDLVDRLHMRRAPLDGVLHLSGDTVYTSITQLLIRRSLFQRIGFFERTWGSVSDFNWNMRAGLVANTVHVPGTWGGWRIHAAQATAWAGLGTRDHARRIDEMIEHAIGSIAPFLAPPVGQRLRNEWSRQAADFRSFELEVKTRPKAVDRRAFIVRRLTRGSPAARTHLRARLFTRPAWRQSFPDIVQSWLQQAGVGAVLIPVSESCQMSGGAERRRVLPATS
jgi:hypothetical protein